jgi:integrase
VPLWDVTDVAFYANLQRYARKAGLPHVTPHVLRHAAAKLRRVTGASLEDVSALLGDRSIATTARVTWRGWRARRTPAGPPWPCCSGSADAVRVRSVDRTSE